jgi:hypothetical protein
MQPAHVVSNIHRLFVLAQLAVDLSGPRRELQHHRYTFLDFPRGPDFHHSDSRVFSRRSGPASRKLRNHHGSVDDLRIDHLSNTIQIQQGEQLVIKYLVVLVFLASCQDRRPDTYSGVSGDVSCSWDIIHEERGQCISEGRRYRCVRQRREDETGSWNHVSCTPFRLWK